MKRTFAFLEHELRLRSRSLSFRIIAGIYLAMGSGPAVLVYLAIPRVPLWLGASTFVRSTMDVLPGLTAITAAIVAATGVLREQEEGSWTVVALASMSNTGYLLRRWLATLAILLPLSAVPLLVAMLLAVAAGRAPTETGVFFWPWLLQVAPLCVSASAFGMALGTLGGGVPGAVSLYFLLVGALAPLTEAALNRLHWTPGSAVHWVGIQNMIEGLSAILYVVGQGELEVLVSLWWYGPIQAATEAPLVPVELARGLFVQGAQAMGISFVLLALAARLLRRTRADHRPWRVSERHPLRTYARLANRAREHFAPDPAPSRQDRVLLAVALLGLLVAVSWVARRELHYRHLAEQRYEEEVSGGPEPSPAEVEPVRWKWLGSLASDGTVQGTLEASMRYGGEEPVSHLAFTLSPGLETEVATQGRTVRVERRMDRLTLRLEPPLLAGEEIELAFELRGRPVHSYLHEIDEFPSFVWRYERWLGARLLGGLKPLAWSWTLPAASRREIRFRPGDLFPIPRYSTWALTPPPTRPGEPGQYVGRERFFPQADLEIRMRAPEGAVLVDSCGGLAEPDAGSPWLEAQCRMAPARYQLRGGRLKVVRTELGGSFLAVLPEHVPQAELHLPALAAATPLFERAWPGTEAMRAVGVEEAPWFDLHAELPRIRDSLEGWERLRLPVAGRLVIFPEKVLIGSTRLEPDAVVGQVVVGRLMAGRQVPSAERLLMGQLLQALVERRLGLGPPRGAVVGHVGVFEFSLREHSLLECESYIEACWETRVPAVVAALESRVGSEPLRRGVDEFFSQNTEEMGSVRGLFDLLALRSGISLERFYEDYIEGYALPELTLEGVEFVQEGREWRATGTVVNREDGEAHCPVVLLTELAPAGVELVVGADEEVPFELRSPYRPQAVVLDPRGVCHRYDPPSVIERVDFKGGSS